MNLFFDAGLAWTENTKVVFKGRPNYETVALTDVRGNPILDQMGRQIFTEFTNERVPALSVGVSLRVNLFGALILEPYYAIPFQRRDLAGRGIFGLNFAPGW